MTTLASFNGGNGAEPQGDLLMDSSGNLYGTTFNAGTSNDGTIFELTAGSSTFTTLATFNGTNGANPAGGLIMDSSGNVYGTTDFGGPDNDGTVFELAKGSSTITTLAYFGGADGEGPSGSLIMDSAGNLYGTTQVGSANDDGTVFEVANQSGTITVLASFTGTNGSTPYGGVIMDSAGNLYGTTFYGGAFNSPAGDGTIFELVKGSNAITTLASFNGTDGAAPDDAPFSGLPRKSLRHHEDWWQFRRRYDF